MAKSPSVLLLIPAYNEEERIGPVLRDYAEYFRKNYDGEFRAVVVLNGCRDNTLGVVEEVAVEYQEIEPLNFPDPIGKGGALIDGFKKAAEAQAVLTGYVDADGATPPSAFHELVKQCAAGEADCLIGSRWLPGAVLHQSQTRLRRIFSRGFHAIVGAQECGFEFRFPAWNGVQAGIGSGFDKLVRIARHDPVEFDGTAVANFCHAVIGRYN